MVLLVDIGNSNINFGVVNNHIIENTFTLKSELNKTCDEYYLQVKSFLENYQLDDIIICSVVPILTSTLKKMFNNHFKKNPILIGPGIKSGVKIKIDDPKIVGADLIADCAGAIKHFDSAIIVDLGTANKYIYMQDKTFMGCAISPGFAISMKALANSAALLPNIEFIKPAKVIGTNTITSMQSGLINGAKGEIETMIKLIKKEINNENIPVIATGGLSKLIIPLCDLDIYLENNLTLEGIYQIYLKNKEAKR